MGSDSAALSDPDALADIRVAAGAARAIQKLPEAVTTAVIEFITGSRLTAPRRVGKPLRRDLAGLYSARRGTFRVLYRMDDAEHLITVVRVEHRSEATAAHGDR